jgi:hypothetical protein
MHTGIMFRSASRRAAVATALVAALVIVAAGRAHSAEIIPSVGLTRAVDSDGDAKVFGGLAFRGHLAPILISEIGIEYRSEDYFDDQLKVRMWPVTASLYLAPVPALYAGAGVGWYNLTLDYDDSLLLDDDTSQEFGVHVGGGLQVPLAPSAAIDLNGRYVFLQEQESPLVPDTFDPDFWSTRLGLALKF